MPDSTTGNVRGWLRLNKASSE